MANTFKSYTKASIGTVQQTVYTAPVSTTTIIIGFAISNRVGSSVTCSVFLVKNGAGDDVYLVRDLLIPGGTLYDFNAGNKIILEAGDYIYVTSNTSSSVDVLVSVLEQT